MGTKTRKGAKKPLNIAARKIRKATKPKRKSTARPVMTAAKLRKRQISVL